MQHLTWKVSLGSALWHWVGIFNEFILVTQPIRDDDAWRVGPPAHRGCCMQENQYWRVCLWPVVVGVTTGLRRCRNDHVERARWSSPKHDDRGPCVVSCGLCRPRRSCCTVALSCSLCVLYRYQLSTGELLLLSSGTGLPSALGLPPPCCKTASPIQGSGYFSTMVLCPPADPGSIPQAGEEDEESLPIQSNV